MSRASHLLHRNVIVVVLAACAPFGIALGALKAAAPKGVDLSGRWKLSPELSEDPHAAVTLARETMKEEKQDKRRKKPRKGADMRMPEERTRMPPGEQVPPPNSNPRPDPNTEEDAEPKESPPIQDRDPLEQAVTSPEEFAIQQEAEAFVLMTTDATDTCRTKRPGQINVPGYGLTDRKCGWDKAGFVMEVEPKNGPHNTVRYEIDKESGRLFVTSELKGERIPKISVKRVYERVDGAD